MVRGAVVAGDGGVGEDGDAAGADEIGDGRLNLEGREIADGVGIIGDGVEHTAAGHHGNADAIDRGVQEVGAMAGRLHPFFLNGVGIGADGDILLDEAEVRAGFCGTAGEIELAGVPMGDGAFNGHPDAVLASRCGQRWIPVEQACSGFGAGLVG